MIAPILVPRGAHHLFYNSRQHSGMIRWWHDSVYSKWHWAALGNQGEETTEREALDRAKRWIRDGQ